MVKEPTSSRTLATRQTDRVLTDCVSTVVEQVGRQRPNQDLSLSHAVSCRVDAKAMPEVAGYFLHLDGLRCHAPRLRL